MTRSISPMHVLAVVVVLATLGLTVARSLGGDIEKDPSLAWRASPAAPTEPGSPPTPGPPPKAVTAPR